MNKKAICSAILSALLFLPASDGYAAKRQEPPVLKVTTQKHVLDNGMTVLVDEVPVGFTVGLYVLVKTGSATEGEFLGSGVSHYLEHMLFKGTEKRAVGTISKEVKSLGGTMNASTSFDYTMYYIELPREHFSQALDILADMMMNSVIDPVEVENERTVVHGEMRLRQDNPSRKLSELIFKTVYKRHPYRHPIIGYKELFDQLTRDDLYKYYKTHYSPNNMIFSVAGNLDRKKVLEEIREKFKDFKRGKPIVRNLPEEPEQISTRRYEEPYPTDLTRMSLVYKGVRIEDKDLFALDILATVIASGPDAPLIKNVADKKLVHKISAMNYTPMDMGAFEIECVLDYDKKEAVIKAVREEIEKFKKKGTNEKKLERVKRNILVYYLGQRESPSGLAYHAAINEAFANDYAFSKSYIEGVSRVTADDIVRVAKKYLTDDNLSIVAVNPIQDASLEESRAGTVKEPEIQKYMLDNGLTVLLREDPTFPLAYINLAMHGGVRQEDEAKNGISKLIATLWASETKSKNRIKMAELKGDTGGGMGAYSGRNSIGMRAHFLAQDTEFMLELLEDVVKNPAFSEEEFEKAKIRQKADVKSRYEDPLHKAIKDMKEMMFTGNVFRLEQLGSEQSIDNIQHTHIREYYEELLAPNNMILSVFGDIDAEEVLASIKKKFGKMKREDVALKTFEEKKPPAQLRRKLENDKEQAIVLIGFHGPKIYEEDRYALDVIDSILGSGLSGRMFNKIRDELGKAYTLSSVYIPGLDAGVFYLFVNTTNENVDQVIEILKSQVEEIKQEDVTDEELADAKAQIISTFYRSLEGNSTLAQTAALDELYGAGYDKYLHWREQINAVSKDDIKRAAGKYLDFNSAAVVTSVSTKPDSKLLSKTKEE